VAYTHGAEFCNDRECKSVFVSTNISHLNHYRNKIKTETDKNTTEDKTLWKFKDELITAVEKTIKENNFKP
jgi:hypothetical protein